MHPRRFTPSMSLLLAFAPQAWMAALATGVMAAVAVWLWKRPEPPIEAAARALPHAGRGR